MKEIIKYGELNSNKQLNELFDKKMEHKDLQLKIREKDTTSIKEKN